MIDGVTTYGSRELTEKLQEAEDEAVFLLTIGTTDTSLIEGISGAGPSAELTIYTPASDADFDTEFLDYILAVKCAEDVNEAVRHIAAHSTGHSEAIVTTDPEAEAIFTTCVDSAAVYVNASTRFTDGGEFGLGGEMGISTQKLHARGPMGLRELTTYKYVIHGNGHTR